MNERILIYDINSTPEFMSLEEVIYGFQKLKIVLYDSERGQQPVVIDKDIVDIIFQDMSGQLSLLNNPLFNPENN